MSNTIKIRRGSGVPTASDFAEYELAYDYTGNDLYVKVGTNMVKVNSEGSGTVTNVVAGSGLTGGGTTSATLEVGAGTGITVNADDVALATAGPGAGTYGSTANSVKIDTITLDAYGRVTAIGTGGTGDISNVIAGTGLSGGNSAGDATLNLDFDSLSTVGVNNLEDEDLFAVEIAIGGAIKKLTASNLKTYIGGGTITSVSGMTNDNVLTASGSTTINGEANLTFDGSTLALTGTLTSTGHLKIADGQAYMAGGGEDVQLFHSNTYGGFLFNQTNHFYFDQVAADKDWIFRVDDSDGGGDYQEVMRIQGSTQNVGIGTASPGALFTVRKDGTQAASVSTTYQIQTVSNSNGGMAIQAGGTSSAYLVFGDNANYDAGRIQYNNSNNQMSFWTADTKHMSITSGGNVGIGETSPYERLYVQCEDATSPGIVSNPSQTNGAVAYAIGYGDANRDYINTWGMSYSAGANVFGFGVKPSTTTDESFINSADNANFKRGALYFDDELKFFNAGAQTGTIDTAITMTQRFVVEDDGKAKLGTGSASFSYGGHGLEIESSSDTSLRLERSSSTAFEISARSSDILLYNPGTARAMRFGIGGTEAMRIDTSRNVLIGRTSAFSSARVEIQNDATEQLTLNNVSTDGKMLSLYNSGSIVGGLGNDVTELVIYQGTTEAMRIDTSQNVGIGTSSPSYKLHLSGTAPELAFTDTDGTKTWRARAVTNNFHITETGAGDPFVIQSGAGANALVINSSGNVGIGTSTPGRTLQVNGDGVVRLVNDSGDAGIDFNSSDMQLRYRSASDKLQVYSYGTSTNVMTIQKSNGNVGIGTDSPSAKLDIVSQGNARTLELTANDNGSSPAYTVSILMRGYEGRGNGIFHTDEDYAGEWFVGNPYTAGNASWQVGYDASGGQAEYKANAQLYIDGGNSRVGIGTTSPQRKLHVSTGNTDIAARFENTTSNGTVMELLTSGDSTTLTLQTDHIYSSSHLYLGSGSKINLYRGSEHRFQYGTGNTEVMRIAGGRVLIGDTSVHYTGVDLQVGSTSDGQNGIQIQTSTTGYGYVLFGDGTGADAYRGQISYKHGDDFLSFRTAGAEALRIDSTQDAHFDQDVIAFSTTPSDIRLKENFTKIENGLDVVSKLEGHTFNWKKGGDRLSAGFKAQEVEKILPHLVDEKKLPLKSDDDKEYKILRYEEMIPYLVEAIKEQQQQINKLEEKLNG